MKALICRVRGHDDEVRARYSDRWGSGAAWRCRRCGRPRRTTSVSTAGMDRLVKDFYAPALRAMLAEPSPFLRYLATSTDTPTLTLAEQAERAALRERRRALAQVLADVAREWDVRDELQDALTPEEWY